MRWRKYLFFCCLMWLAVLMTGVLSVVSSMLSSAACNGKMTLLAMALVKRSITASYAGTDWVCLAACSPCRTASKTQRIIINATLLKAHRKAASLLKRRRFPQPLPHRKQFELKTAYSLRSERKTNMSASVKRTDG